MYMHQLHHILQCDVYTCRLHVQAGFAIACSCTQIVQWSERNVQSEKCAVVKCAALKNSRAGVKFFYEFLYQLDISFGKSVKSLVNCL